MARAKTSPAVFYVTRYFVDGMQVAQHTSDTDDAVATFDEALKMAKRQDEQGAAEIRSPFADVFTEYSSIMLGYLEFVPIFAVMAQQFSTDMRKSSLSVFLDKRGEMIKEEPALITHRLPIKFYNEYVQLTESLTLLQDHAASVPRMLIVGLVSSLEFCIGQTMRAVAAVKPERVFHPDGTIPIADLMSASSINELKLKIIDKNIDAVLRKTLSDRISWIENHVEISEPISRGFQKWSNLMELSARRNIFVHGNSSINKQYLQASEDESFSLPKNAKIGTKLNANAKYFTNSVRLACEFGCKLIIVSWLKAVSSDREEADKLINNFGYDLLERGHYPLAERILEFSANLRNPSSEASRLRSVVNWANALRLMNKDEESTKVLDQEDWSAASDLFRMCVASIRRRADVVVSIMKNIGRNDDVIGAWCYREWPVFYHVRDDERFRSQYKRMYKEEYSPAPRERASPKRLLALLSESAAVKREAGELAEGDAMLDAVAQKLH